MSQRTPLQASSSMLLAGRLTLLKHHLNQATLKFRNLPEPLWSTIETANMVCPLFCITDTVLGYLTQGCSLLPLWPYGSSPHSIQGVLLKILILLYDCRGVVFAIPGSWPRVSHGVVQWPSSVPMASP